MNIRSSKWLIWIFCSSDFRIKIRAGFRISMVMLSMLGASAVQGVAEDSSAPQFFGSKDQSELAMVGIIYDLKQTQKREPTHMDVATGYVAVVDEFLEKDWDESVLNKYFRCARPLYTTQIFIPYMGAGEAPKAFGMEKVIKPSLWIAHYKGQVSPPEPGTYRFVGYADDLLAVAINEKTVLSGSRFDIKVWKPKEKPGGNAANGTLAYGDWITIGKDEVIDIDVLIGERPGGIFNAFLLYQKQGEPYALDEKGFPILPIFQLAPFDTPVRHINESVRFARTAKYWKGH